MASRLAQLASHITGHPGTGGPIPAPLTGNLLQDQVCLITGSGQGIGRSCALLFAAHGAKVVISDLDGAKADSVRKEIEDAGGKDTAITVAGNVMEDGFAERLVKAAVDKWGKINVIVNNAGFTK
jgi:3-oxoacyl-[acyl-carrier protein] reductase